MVQIGRDDKVICDTLVALKSATNDNSVIFGKNSDRPYEEVQLITYSPAAKHSNNDEVKCTYISIPQVSETYAILLSQPWWMFGSESGCNQHGVVIGNEAVYTKEPVSSVGLLGMDLLRLGLERGKTAIDALKVITGLLETYGQGGGCAFNDNSWRYHNSYIIADPKDAYVLETADKWWIVEKVKTVRSISNNISIRGKGDFRREKIIEHAIKKGYCKDDDEFDFAKTFSEFYISDKISPYSRGSISKKLLTEKEGFISPKLMMDFLREHNAGICMHGGFESTGSQVSHLKNEIGCSVHWFTGTSLPCLSLYKPYVFPIDNQIVLKPGPYPKINPKWYWNKYSNLTRKFNYNSHASEKQSFISIIRSFENSMIDKIHNLIKNNCTQNNQEFHKNIQDLNLTSWEYFK